MVRNTQSLNRIRSGRQTKPRTELDRARSSVLELMPTDSKMDDVRVMARSSHAFDGLCSELNCKTSAPGNNSAVLETPFRMI